MAPIMGAAPCGRTKNLQLRTSSFGGCGGRTIAETAPWAIGEQRDVEGRRVGQGTDPGVEERGLRCSIDAGHLVIPWMFGYAASLLHRFKDGRSASERNTWKAAKTFGLEFGDGAWSKEWLARTCFAKSFPSRVGAVLVGVKGTMCDIIAGDEAGIWGPAQCEDARRMGVDRAWRRNGEDPMARGR